MTLLQITIDGLARILCMSEYLDDKGKGKKSPCSKTKHLSTRSGIAELSATKVTANPDGGDKLPVQTSALPAPSYGEVSNSTIKPCRYADVRFGNRQQLTKGAELSTYATSNIVMETADEHKSVDVTVITSPTVGGKSFGAGRSPNRPVTEEQIELFTAPSLLPAKHKSPVVDNISFGPTFRATVRSVDEALCRPEYLTSSGDDGKMTTCPACVGDDAGNDNQYNGYDAGTGRGRGAARLQTDCSPWRESIATPAESASASVGRHRPHHNNHHHHQHHVEQHQPLLNQTADDDNHLMASPSVPTAGTFVAAPNDPPVAFRRRQPLTHQQHALPEHRLLRKQHQQHYCSTCRQSPEDTESSTASTSGVSTTPPPTAPPPLPKKTTTLSTSTAANQQPLQQQLPVPVGMLIHASPAMESDLNEIRSMLNLYMRRLDNKDTSAKVTKEWRVVARVFDRLFFYTYCATILVSLATIFPRAHD